MDRPEILKAVLEEREKFLSGLDSPEAQKRQQQFGLNELPRFSKRWMHGFLDFFWGPIPWCFMVTAGICIIARLWLQAELVGTGFLALALLGCLSEYVGRRRVVKLRAKLNRKVSVERDGQWQELPARQLVPGDLIQLKRGEIVPADVYIIGGEGVGINIVHSNALLSRVYQEGDLLYCGSPIRYGEADAVVCITGTQTKLGEKVQWLIAHMNAASFYENPIRFDNSILHFDEPLGGEWRAMELLHEQ